MIATRLALSALLVAAAAGCGGSSSSKDAGPSPTPCTDLPSADASAKMPAGLPAVDGQVLYEPSTQGKTSIVFGLLQTSDFVKVRDDYVDKLKAAGWKIDGTDQESVEAEAQFSKNPPLQTGTVKVAPASCAGYVTVRYKVNL